MSKDFDIEIDITRFEHKWGMFNEIVGTEVKKLLQSFIADFARSMEKNRMRAHWNNPFRRSVGTRTGTLKKEFAASIVLKAPNRFIRGFKNLLGADASSLDGMYARATMGGGLSRKYAQILETGGTIRKKKKKLKVPMPAALTRAGVVKKEAMVRRSLWRRNKGLTVLVRKRGGETKVFLGIKTPKGQDDIFYWILKDQVTIKARLGYYRHFDEFKRREQDKYINRAVRNVTAKFERA